MKKVYATAEEAVADVSDGVTAMFGGFGLSGNPENLIKALHIKGVKDLTVISNNCGTDDFGLGFLLKDRLIKKIIASYVGENKTFERQMLAGEVEVELNPQGTLAERIRAGGAGIEAFYTPTGVGTVIAEGKETREINGKMCVLETALRADYAFVKAWTSRNFNPMMATAGKITIAEVEELVEVGELDPNDIHTPGIFVQRIIQGKDYQKPIEKRTTRPRPQEGA